MADVRLTPGLPALRGAPSAPARSDAVRAAQRAFFDAALNQADATAPVRRPTQTTAAAPAGGAARVSSEPPPADGRYRRPGSFLDIKV